MAMATPHAQRKLTILDNGHTVVISIMGPDITLTIEVDDDGEDVGIANPASVNDG